jgi:hypothetical protein
MVRPSPTEPRDRRAAVRPSTLAAPEVDTADWPAQAAEQIERAVQNVRDKTTGPAINAARWFVAGLFLLIAGTMSVILVVVLAVRFLNAYLPDSVFGDHHIWAAYGILGALVSSAGVFLLSRRSTPTDGP